MENHLVEIVRLPVSDWREYKKLRLEALQTAPQAFGSSYADNLTKPDSFWQSRLEAAAKGSGSWLLFAREEQRLVGMIGAFLEEDDPRAATIISVFVTGEARGKKISSALMRAILSELKHYGIRKARLSVNTRQLPALALYHRFGFEIIQTDEHQLMGNGEYVDEYLMEKSLDD